MAASRGRWAMRAACVVALLWCGFVLLVHLFAGGFACHTDTSYCAQGRHKDGVYRGVLADVDGRVLPNTRFTVSFESRRGADPQEAGPFSTDGRGRYCIIWARERIVPFAYSDGRPVGGMHDADWTSLEGARSPRECQEADEGIPWDRADGVERTWQYLSLLIVLFTTVLLLLGAILEPRARWARRTGLAGTVASTVLCAILWWL